MAVPKKRKSHSATRKQRSHDALKPVYWSTCPQCRELKLPHRVCDSCGFYRGKEVIAQAHE